MILWLVTVFVSFTLGFFAGVRFRVRKEADELIESDSWFTEARYYEAVRDIQKGRT